MRKIPLKALLLGGYILLLIQFGGLIVVLSQYVSNVIDLWEYQGHGDYLIINFALCIAGTIIIMFNGFKHAWGRNLLLGIGVCFLMTVVYSKYHIFDSNHPIKSLLDIWVLSPLALHGILLFFLFARKQEKYI